MSTMFTSFSTSFNQLPLQASNMVVIKLRFSCSNCNPKWNKSQAHCHRYNGKSKRKLGFTKTPKSISLPVITSASLTLSPRYFKQCIVLFQHKSPYKVRNFNLFKFNQYCCEFDGYGSRFLKLMLYVTYGKVSWTVLVQEHR